MRKGLYKLPLVLLVLLAALLPCRESGAQTKRALIIGINRYVVNPRGDRATDLDGAVNDAEAMVQSLHTYHGFQMADIHLLLDQQATRARILSEIRQHLIAAAQPGDISLLFFAGHGSYQENPHSSELDRHDETIVPADANRDVPDITDKQISQLLNQAIDRKANVIAIFDSCHSGSISRGYYSSEKVRYVAPARGLRTPEPIDVTQDPEARGALILAAAQAHQQAQEKFVKGQPRGRFTSALQQLLNSGAVSESTEFLFLRLRALMQAGGSIQEPVLLASKQRRTQPLWGMAETRRSPPRVAVGRLTSSLAFLQAGFAIGLGAGAVLRSTQGNEAIELEVTEVLGPGTSKARVKSGNIGKLNAGDLFEVESFGAPYLEPLHLFVPTDPPSRKELEETARVLASLMKDRSLTWIQDPTEQTPTHTLFWQAGQWFLRTAQQAALPLSGKPSLKQVQKLLRGKRGEAVRFFLSLPLPEAQLAALKLGREGSPVNVIGVADPARADYLLLGRWLDGKAAYSLILPGVDGTARPGLPLRTDWISLEDSELADLLTEHAYRLARLKMWQRLETPAGANRFPYVLRLQNMNSQGFLLPAARVRNGEIYRPTLVVSQPSAQPQPRYIYLFSMDSAGRSTLLVPGAGMGIGENVVPDPRQRGAPPAQIPVGDPIRVSPPYGTETLVLLSSATALPDPSVVIVEPVQRGRGPADPCAHPLSCLINGINKSKSRSRFAPPTDWSIDRVIVESAK